MVYTFVFNSESSGQPATRYVSGFSGSESVLILASEGSLGQDKGAGQIVWAKLILDGRYWTQAEAEVQSTGYKVQSGGVEIVKVHKDYTSKQAIAGIIQQYNMTQCVVDSRTTSYASVFALQQQGLTVTPSTDIFQMMREIKDEDEITKIRKAQQIALSAFDEVQAEIRVGVRESYIAARLEFGMKLAGAERVAFETIVASGARSALPHAHTTDKEIEDSDAVIVDFGAVYQGYCSDFTRTILMPHVSDKLRTIYTVVEDAQKAAVHKAVAGTPLVEIDHAARSYIEKKGYGDHFIHATGHGVGMVVHELPHVSSRAVGTLREGHVITIEPGIYIPELGGVRLEEMVII